MEQRSILQKNLLIVYMLSFILIMFIAGCALDQQQAADNQQVTGIEETDLSYAVDNFSTISKCYQQQDYKTWLIKTFNQYLLENNVQSILSLLAEDVEWKVVGDPAHVPFANIYHGKKEVRQYFNNFLRAVKISSVELKYCLVEGNNINAHTVIRAYVNSTGKTFDLEFVFATEINNYLKIKKSTTYYDTYHFYLAFVPGGERKIRDLRSTDTTFTPWTTGAKEVTQKLYNAFLEGDMATMTNTMASDIAWLLKGDTTIVPITGEFYGKQGVLDFVDTLLQVAYYTDLKIFYTVQTGNRVDYHVHEELMIYATGKKMSLDILQSFIVKDGKVKEFLSFNDSYNAYNAFLKN